MTRALGVDLGSRRIGLALSDAGGTTASALAVIDRGRWRAQDHEAIIAAALEHGARVIVVGLPLTLDGATGTAARRVLAEVDELRRAAATAGSGVRVEAHDERMTTVTAERAMKEAGVRRDRRRQGIDKVAAAVMLQSWLDRPQGQRP